MIMVDLSTLSREELDALERKIAEERESAARARREQIDTYKDLVSGAVEEAFEELLRESRALAVTKNKVYELFASVKEMKSELFQTKRSGQWSHTFTDKEGSKRITLGTNTINTYDDTANEGIAMVNEYLDKLAEKSPEAQEAVELCRSLLARDKKGNLQPARIVTLYKQAQSSRNERFIEGVDIIMNAYNPTPSKTYIRAEFKNELGEWVNVPLGMTEAE